MKRKKNRKQDIHQVSARLFREKGYAATSIRDIAENVGLEPSSLYSHIKSKEEVLTNICNECAQLFADGMSEIYTSDLNSQSKLDALIDLHIDIAFTKPSSVTVFNDEWRHLPSDELVLFLSKRKEYEDKFKSIIQEGIKNGFIEEISRTTALNIIINSVKWLHFYSKKLSQEEFEVKKTEVKRFINKGLGKQL